MDAAMQQTKRLDNIFALMLNSFRKNEATRNALAGINLLEQPILVKAISERIPSIVNDTMPDIAKFREHRRDLAVKRNERKKTK